jgi:hypothetical protein
MCETSRDRLSSRPRSLMVSRSGSGAIWKRFLGRSVPSSGDPRAFQQERVALYAKIQLFLLGSFYLIDAISGAVQRGLHSLLEIALLAHLGLTLFLLGAWLIARAGER